MTTISLYHSPVVELLENKPQHEHVLYQNGASYTVADMLRYAEHIACHLHIQGFQEKDRAVLIAEPNIEFISTLYAIIMLKGTAAIIDPDMGTDLFFNRLKQFSPQWLFIDYRLVLLQRFTFLRRLYERLKSNAFFVPYVEFVKYVIMGKSLSWLGYKKNIIDYKKEVPNVKTEWQKSAHIHHFLVTYTSGTLDVPKGVLHSDRSITTSLKMLGQKIGKYQGCHMVSYLPHFALIGIQANVKVFLWKKEMKIADKIMFVAQHDIHIFFGPPVEMNEILDYCIENDLPFLPSMKYILLGSAPVYTSFLKKLLAHTDAEVECLYGMTENLLVSSIKAEEKIAYEGNGDIVGMPFDGVKVAISDEQEIMIQSNQLFSGYLKQAPLNEDAFHPTGDLGFLDSQGRIVLTGRKKNMIIRKEYNIYPGLYEPIINKIPKVEQAVMIGKYNENSADEEVYLIVETKQKITSQQIMTQLKHGNYTIDVSALPDHIVFADIPRRGRQQKIDYAVLKKMIA